MKDTVTIEQVHQMAAWFFWSGGVVLSGVAAIAAVLGMLCLTLVVAPGITKRSAGALRERNVLSFLAGAAVFAFFFLIAAFVGKHVPVVGLACAAAFTVLGLCGLTAASEDVGRRLAKLANREDASRVRQLVTGWIVVGTASCVPLLGWFIVLPYAVLSGLGSIVVGTVRPPAPVGASREKPVDLEIR